jgi:hypothetical protein
LSYGYIVQGDNLITIDFTIDRVEVSSLEDATVTVFIKRGNELLDKQVEIIDPVAKTCRFTLTNFDLTISGRYFYQYTVNFTDGRVYTREIEALLVSNKLVGNTTIILDGGTF